MNCVFPCLVKNVSSNRLPPFELGWSLTTLCSEGLASFLDCAQSVKVSHPQRGCQKKQHPSNSHTVTLAGRTWPWKPFGSCLCCSLDPMLIQRWCLADVWYREDVVCGPPPTWLKSSTNALTAGGPPPPKKCRLTNVISVGALRLPPSTRLSLWPRVSLKLEALLAPQIRFFTQHPRALILAYGRNPSLTGR